jgi:hypothetical protein
VTNDQQTAPKNPAALSPADAATLLSRLSGRPIAAALIAADVEAGAPTNADGTLNLVHYAAWLVRERRGG